MFSSTVQPSLLSLFSSTNTEPLALFGIQTDPSLPADSFVHLLYDRSSQPALPPPAVPILPPPLLLGSEADGPDASLHQTVLHMQSPTLRTTFIECPRGAGSLRASTSAKAQSAPSLDLKHPWVHLQVRDLGREWSFELGIVDQAGRAGIVRLSTFQKEPRLKLPPSPGSLPILHLPLAFPSQSSHRLTAWSTIAINLPTLIPYFSTLKSAPARENVNESGIARSSPVPRGLYSHASYIRIYATCRLRRVWFSNFGPSRETPWEFKLYGSD